MMRILVLVHEFPPVGGGGGHVAEDICRELSKRGHRINILTSHIKGLPHEEDRDGFHIIRLRSLREQPYRASFLSMLVYVITGLYAGLRLIRRWRPDIIHVHFAVPAGALAWMLSKLTGIPYMLTTHLGDIPGGVSEKTNEWFRFVFPLTPLIWKDANRVTAVSNYTRTLAKKHYHVDIDIIYNGIDLTLLDLGDLQVHTPPRVVFAGRFMEQKNPVQVANVLAKLRNLEWECTMLGDGPLLSNVKKIVAEHGMEKRFTFPGWVTQQEVLDWFGKSDILFLPSLSEGLPVVGVQALVKGLAIVASRVGGFVDLVEEGGNGYLVSPHDEVSIINALQPLLMDAEKLQRARYRSREIARRFDIISIVDTYEEYMESITNFRKNTER